MPSRPEAEKSSQYEEQVYAWQNRTKKSLPTDFFLRCYQRIGRWLSC
jgi:hypothetical protein